MGYVVVFIAGAIFGFVMAAIFTVGKDSDR